ncbi:MAG: hypothetical protein EOO03_17375, partial [Chitinophagaceae bacterium]
NAQEKALPAQTFLNVAYGSDSLQRMDIYLPANRTSESIRDFIAFPKNNSGRDVMLDAPASIDNKQLDELSIKLDVKEK